MFVCPHREIVFGNADSWRGIQELSLRENVSGGEPNQGTVVRCAWTDTAFHVLFACVDAEPWATITERDGRLWEEEVVEVFIDPVGDLESYFELEVNPLNTVLDLVLRKNRGGYRKDIAWDCEDLQTTVTRMSSGWNAEFLIPFTALVAQRPHRGSRWRVNFYRIDRPKNKERELSAWWPTLSPTFHVPKRFGVLQFG